MYHPSVEGTADHPIVQSEATKDSSFHCDYKDEVQDSLVLSAAQGVLELLGNHVLAAHIFSTLPETAQSTRGARKLQLSINQSAARDAARIAALAQRIKSQWPDDPPSAAYFRYAVRHCLATSRSPT